MEEFVEQIVQEFAKTDSQTALLLPAGGAVPTGQQGAAVKAIFGRDWNCRRVNIVRFLLDSRFFRHGVSLAGFLRGCKKLAFLQRCVGGSAGIRYPHSGASLKTGKLSLVACYRQVTLSQSDTVFAAEDRGMFTGSATKELTER